jgi:hypothetical protein
MPVKVFGSPTSAEVARVLACLFEKDVEFQLIRVDSFRGPKRLPQYLKLQVLSQNSATDRAIAMHTNAQRKQELRSLQYLLMTRAKCKCCSRTARRSHSRTATSPSSVRIHVHVHVHTLEVSSLIVD